MDIYIEKESSLLSRFESIRIIHQIYPDAEIQVIDEDKNVLETLNVKQLFSLDIITPLQPVNVKPVYYSLSKQEYIPIEGNKNPYTTDYMGLCFGGNQCTLMSVVFNVPKEQQELIEVMYDFTNDGEYTIGIYHEGKLCKEMNTNKHTTIPWYLHLRSLQESLSLKYGTFTVDDVIECVERLIGVYDQKYTMQEFALRLNEGRLNDPMFTKEKASTLLLANDSNLLLTSNVTGNITPITGYHFVIDLQFNTAYVADKEGRGNVLHRYATAQYNIRRIEPNGDLVTVIHGTRHSSLDDGHYWLLDALVGLQTKLKSEQSKMTISYLKDFIEDCFDVEEVSDLF